MSTWFEFNSVGTCIHCSIYICIYIFNLLEVKSTILTCSCNYNNYYALHIVLLSELLGIIVQRVFQSQHLWVLRLPNNVYIAGGL